MIRKEGNTMAKENEGFSEKLLVFAGKIANQRHLLALRDGIILSMPLLIAGSIFLILAAFPVPAYSNFMLHIFGKGWDTKMLYPVYASFSIMGLIAAFGIAYHLAKSYHVDALSAGIISVSAFVLTIPVDKIGNINMNLLGSQGLFTAIILAIVSTEIYRVFIQKNIVIKMPDSVPQAVSKSFSALIPGFVVILLIWVIRLLIELTPMGSIPNIVTSFVSKPLGVLGTSFAGSFTILFIELFLWIFGIHGAGIVNGIMAPIWLGAMDQNRIAFMAHQPLPNIITQQFFDNFIAMGGSGTTIGLALMLVFMSKSRQMKTLGKLAIVPSLFNINEPILFGLPIVLNPIMVIPFLISPLVVFTTTYVSMKLGWVAWAAGVSVPWTTPPIISGFLATGGHISGSIIQIVNIALTFFIYYPFFKFFDNQKVKDEKQSKTSESIKTSSSDATSSI
jgi:phosphotransferase system, cellobiose specific, IIC component